MADKQSFLVLNLGSQRVGAARFVKSKGGGLILKDFRHTSILGDPGSDASRIPQIELAVAELAEEMGMGKSLVRFAISGQAVFTRFVKLPPIGDEKIADIVQFEAQQNVPFPINEVVWDYQLVGEEVGKDVEAVIAAIKADQIDLYNEAVEASGIRTAGVDLAHMALYNAFRYNYSDVAGSALLIDIGARGTNLIISEGNKLFTRNVPVGGSTVTTAIEKEFHIPFAKAEELKIEKGFVALGGAYAPHPDPEIAAVSKVVRDSLTRLHMEVGRTVSYFTKQQGGSRPGIVYLAGGTAGLPYIREFFGEKLNLPVEFFNPLRNVSVDPKLDVDRVGAEAHTLGELVGLGLREIGTCPMELDLVPASVERARATRRMTPYLIVMALTVLAVLGAGVFFFKHAEAETGARLGVMNSKRGELQQIDNQINVEQNRQNGIDVQAAQLQGAVYDRTYWLRVVSELSANLQNDLLWITKLEPMIGETSATEGKLGQKGVFGGTPPKPKPGQTEDPNKPKMVDAVRVSGLWRFHDNPNRNQVVIAYLSGLKNSEVFDLSAFDPGKADAFILKNDPGVANDRWAYPFEIRLPLKTPITVNPIP